MNVSNFAITFNLALFGDAEEAISADSSHF